MNTSITRVVYCGWDDVYNQRGIKVVRSKSISTSVLNVNNTFMKMTENKFDFVVFRVRKEKNLWAKKTYLYML